VHCGLYGPQYVGLSQKENKLWPLLLCFQEIYTTKSRLQWRQWCVNSIYSVSLHMPVKKGLAWKSISRYLKWSGYGIYIIKFSVLYYSLFNIVRGPMRQLGARGQVKWSLILWVLFCKLRQLKIRNISSNAIYHIQHHYEEWN